MKRLLLALMLLWLAALTQPTLAADTVYYYYTNSLHSAVVVTDAHGNVVERTYYAPYGQVLNRAMRNGPGYTGHEEDPATGLVYMQQRYYDPQSGRFLSNDPVQPTDGGANFNRYWYANDNPYRYTDPDGRESGNLSLRSMEYMQGNLQAFDSMESGFTPESAKTGVAVGLIIATVGGAGEAVGLVKAAVTVDKALSDARTATTITRYMGPEEAKVSARTGEIPNVGKDGITRPTHVTTDAPVNSAAKAQEKYELPATPTHRATVPANRVNDLGATPDGRSVTSGGGRQNATNQPIPIKPDEIKQLDH